jgi:aspartokinase-like uncharacterized kinase
MPPLSRPLAASEASAHPDICDVFIKVGGSVLDDSAITADLVPCFLELSKEYRLVSMCGGGRVAKRIVENQKKQGSHFLHSWKAGITSLDVHAGLLASYSADFAVACSVFEIANSLANGKMAVLAPAGKIVSDLVMFPDYEVTTDSMGLYFASLLGAHRYVVVSNVDGIYERAPGTERFSSPISRLTPEELEQLPSSKLDPAFPAYFRRYPLPVMVVNGAYPARVMDAVRGRATIGTEIVSV